MILAVIEVSVGRPRMIECVCAVKVLLIPDQIKKIVTAFTIMLILINKDYGATFLDSKNMLRFKPCPFFQ